MKYRSHPELLRNEALLEAPPAGGVAPPTPPPAPPAAPAPPATPSTVFNPDGTFAAGWHQALGDEFAPHTPTLQNFKDVRGLAKSYLHLQKHGPAYPEPNAAPEDIARFRSLAKVPETPEGYGIQPPAEMPPGISFDADVAAEFAKLAHAHHVPAPALQALVAKQFQIEAARHTAFQESQKAEQQAALDDLVKSWGGKYQENSSIVRHHTERLAEAAGIAPDDPAFAQLANTPAFSKIMLQVARLTAEDRVATPSGLGDLRSPQERANAIMDGQDPQWGQRYREGDPEAYKIVASLLTRAAQ